MLTVRAVIAAQGSTLCAVLCCAASGKLTMQLFVLARLYLKDYTRTATYQQAMLINSVDFSGKVVCDVGTGTGMLSFFAVQVRIVLSGRARVQEPMEPNRPSPTGHGVTCASRLAQRRCTAWRPATWRTMRAPSWSTTACRV